MRWPQRPDEGGPRWPWRAEFGRGQARSAPRGLTWRELAGTFSGPDGGSVADGRRQAGNGRARNRARARLNWVFQGQRWGRCKVRRRAERVSRPAREQKRRRRVLVVTTCSPRPMRAVQRARLWAITWMASQAPLAAKREGLRDPRSLGILENPAWADSHNDPLGEPDGVSIKGGRRNGARTISSTSWLAPPRDLVRPMFSNI